MKRILVVDDSDVILKFFSIVLGHAGYEVETAEHGEAALERLGAGRFDLVITDINMPRMDGFSLLRELKARHADLPCIILTTEDEAEDLATGLSLGAALYLVKPAEPDELVASVSKVLAS